MAEEPDEADVEELTRLVLDELGPVVVAHRREVARAVGIEPDGLLVLDLLGRLGPLPANALGSWLGTTRSGTAKILRRLEAGGHVERRLRSGHRQELEVARLPHDERDSALDRLRARVRRAVRAAVADLGLAAPGRHDLVAGWTARTMVLLHHEWRVLVEEDAAARRRERLRRERARDPARFGIR